LHSQGRTVVLITHEEDIAAYTERVVKLRDGRIVDDYAQDPAAARDLHVAHAQAGRVGESR
jgi:ABC-type lipoprotein export system ATPase subunit